MKKYIMALDAGTTSNRCILFDHDGKICSVAQKEFTQYFPKPGWVEHDANEIWTTQLGVALSAMNKIGATAEDIAAIGIAPAYARAPGGQWQRMGSYGVGWPLIQWTAEAQDWSGGDQGPDAYRTANTIAASTKDGGIILMHDMKINSAKATEMFIPKLEERGFMLLTVDELFAKDGVTLEANQAYWRCLDGVTTQY